jgi:hypothetical protein
MILQSITVPAGSFSWGNIGVNEIDKTLSSTGLNLKQHYRPDVYTFEDIFESR